MSEEELRTAVLDWRQEIKPVGGLTIFLQRRHSEIDEADLRRALQINAQISDQVYKRRKTN